MKIETKFNIGDKVWVVYEYNGELSVYSGVVDGFGIDKDKDITVYLKDGDGVGYCEDNLILYDDTEALVDKMIDMDIELKEI